jgi:hypothetical protein
MKCSSLKHSGSETKIVSLDDTRVRIDPKMRSPRLLLTGRARQGRGEGGGRKEGAALRCKVLSCAWRRVRGGGGGEKRVRRAGWLIWSGGGQGRGEERWGPRGAVWAAWQRPGGGQCVRPPLPTTPPEPRAPLRQPPPSEPVRPLPLRYSGQNRPKLWAQRRPAPLPLRSSSDACASVHWSRASPVQPHSRWDPLPPTTSSSTPVLSSSAACA